MLELFLDEYGEIVEQDWAKHQAAASRLPDSTVQDYAVRRLHCVHLRLSGTTIYVALEPSRLSLQQASALLQHMSDKSFDMLVLTTHADGGWCNEIFASRDRALACIGDFRERARTTGTATRVTRYRVQDLVNHHPFAELAGCWKPELSLREIGQFIDRTALYSHDRFALTEQCGHGSDFVIREYGDGYPPYAASFMDAWRGRAVSSHPDERYGRDCVLAFARASRDRTVAIELVDATIYWPLVGNVHRTYTRALLPFSDSAGRSWVLSTSLSGNGFAT